MGGKQWKDRKHLLFYGACFLIVLLSSEGCIIPQRKVQVLPEGGAPLERASLLVKKGKYDDALEVYGNVARSYPGGSPGDQALFEMGLIWSYPSNPKKNHVEALKYFQRLLHDFPRSPFKEEALAWVDVLSRIARHDGQVKELEDKIISCKEQINSYKNQISALKEIDIGIEERKRKGLPEE